ncbi:hypothetical protein NXW94_30165 [Bacteroides ovatus]|nr:hypothetical protein [Bacteroides ovatus]
MHQSSSIRKSHQATGARYERLPDSLKNISRAPLWNLSRNSAGMAIRFRTIHHDSCKMGSSLSIFI